MQFKGQLHLLDLKQALQSNVIDRGVKFACKTTWYKVLPYLVPLFRSKCLTKDLVQAAKASIIDFCKRICHDADKLAYGWLGSQQRQDCMQGM